MYYTDYAQVSIYSSLHHRCIPILSSFYSKVIHWYLWPIHQHSDNSYPQGLHFPSRGPAITETVRGTSSVQNPRNFSLKIKHVLVVLRWGSIWRGNIVQDILVRTRLLTFYSFLDKMLNCSVYRMYVEGEEFRQGSQEKNFRYS